MYDIGYAFGRLWARSEATGEQRQDVQALGDGHKWAASRQNPTSALSRVVDRRGNSFLESIEEQPASFVAGFIDSVRDEDGLLAKPVTNSHREAQMHKSPESGTTESEADSSTETPTVSEPQIKGPWRSFRGSWSTLRQMRKKIHIMHRWRSFEAGGQQLLSCKICGAVTTDEL